MDELEGIIERIVYEAEETGYTVARFSSPQFKGKELTVVGKLVACAPGEHVKLRGRWRCHPKYGEQFEVEDYQTTTPATVAGIKKYLGSGLIKGIGPVMAERIAEHFGLETLEVIGRDPDRLAEVEGIGKVRAERIKRAWEEQKEIREVMLFLKAHDVSTAYAAKIYKTYGQRAIRVVKENPYQLAEDIYGIGFVTADRIARDLGIAPDAPQRLQAGILHTLSEAADREGHVYLPRGELTRRCREILEADSAKIEQALADASASNAQASRQIVIEDKETEGPAVYLVAFHTAERGLARRLEKLLATPGPVPTSAKVGVAKLIERAKGKGDIPYSEQQLAALRAVLSEKLVILTGGPGTGKTTTVRGMIRLLEGLDLKVELAAPTGRAAKRLSEATGRPARTIHRLLEYSPQEGFIRDNKYPLKLDALIVDELSMVDLPLMYHLSKAVLPRAILVLVGDVDQLPAVGAGNVLHNLIDSGVPKVIELTEIFRQAHRSWIITNAHRINNGEFPELKSQQDGDFFFLERDDPEEAAHTIEELVTRRLPDHYGFDPVDDIQVLSPMYRGAAGVDALNRTLQQRLNPQASSFLFSGGRQFRRGDKVMQVRNNYEKDVFNGDIGRVAAVDPVEGQLMVEYPGRGPSSTRVLYETADLGELVPAYAVTVHKAQGSEYRAVVLPWLTQHYMMLQRNLLYTAVTRAKELVVIVGTKKALSIAIRNNQQAKRYSGLVSRLAGDL